MRLYWSRSRGEVKLFRRRWVWYRSSRGGTVGSDWRSVAGARSCHHLQHSEPAWADPPRPVMVVPPRSAIARQNQMNLKHHSPTLNQSNRPGKSKSHNVVNHKSMGKDEDSCSRRVALNAANGRREN